MQKEIMTAVEAMQADQIKLLAAHGVPPDKIMEITRCGNMGTVAFVSSITTPKTEMLQEIPFGTEFSIRPVSVTIDEGQNVVYKMLPYYHAGSHPVYGKLADCVNLESDHNDHASYVVAQMVVMACRELDKLKEHGIDIEAHNLADLLSVPYPWTVRFVERIIYADNRDKDVTFELPEGKLCDIIPITIVVVSRHAPFVESVGETILTDDAVIRRAIAENHQRQVREKFERMDMEHAAMSRRDDHFSGGIERGRVVVLGAGRPAIGAHLLAELRGGGIPVTVEFPGPRFEDLMADTSHYTPGDGVIRDSKESKRSKNEIVMTEKGNMYPRPKQRLGRH